MSTSDVQMREVRADDADVEGGANASGEITSILQNITALIAAADRRQEEALRELHVRLESLGHEARSVRDQVPDEYAPDFERIEEGLSQIAGRITRAEMERAALRAEAERARTEARAGEAVSVRSLHAATPTTAADEEIHEPHQGLESVPEAAAPAPLRSALVSSDGLRGTLRSDAGRSPPAGIDPFDIVESTRPGDPDHPWDLEAAEALTRVYESLAGKSRPEPVQEAKASLYEIEEPLEPIPAEAKFHQPEPVSAEADTSHTPAPAPVSAQHPAPQLDFGRDWLEARFADIAMRVEQSMAEFRAAPVAVDLDDRFDQLESRFGEVLEGVTARADTGGLGEFKTHLDDLAQQVETAQLQLQRLDTIEAQLNAVMDKLSDQRLSQILEQSSPAGIDAERIAQAAAEQVAERLSSLVPAASGEDAKRLDALRDMLDTFMTERRQGEEQTAGMLDTMQHAMIQLLDRVDALEVPARGSMNDTPESDYAPAPVAALAAAPEARPAAPRAQPEDKPARVEPSLQPPAAKQPAAAEEAAPEAAKADEVRPQMRVTDMTRDQLIAEARRAMQAAAAKREAEAELAAAQEASPQRKDREAGTAAGGISKSTRRIMVGACTLLLLSSAVLLLMPRKQPAQPAGDPKAATQLKPAEKTAASPDKPAAPAQGANGATALPAPAQPPVEPAAKAPDKSAEAPKAGRQAIPPGFLPQSVPETGVDDLSSPVDLGSGRGVVQESRATGSAVFPGITLHRGPELNPLDVARVKEQQRVADLSTRIGQAHSAAMQETGSIPVAYAPDVMMQQARPADGPSAARSLASAAVEMPPLTIGPNSLRQAAAKGDPSAEFEVAARFAEGKGIPQDFNQAMRWYQRAASQSYAPAQYRLGTLYERGLGVKADLARARVWYQQAANQGHVKAMHNLAVLSASRDGGSPDYAAAGRWFKEAAERGLADSQYNLAVLCESGLGMQKDLPQAYKWFSIAARSGDKEARRRLDILRMKLTASEIAAGEGMVASYQPRPVDRMVNDAHAAGEAWKSRASSEPAG